MNYLIGIDLGTSSTKTVLFDEKGEVIASASKDYPLYTPHNGWAEQKPEDWRDAALETITKVVKDSGVAADDIKGLGISGQMYIYKPGIRWNLIFCSIQVSHMYCCAFVFLHRTLLPAERWPIPPKNNFHNNLSHRWSKSSAPCTDKSFRLSHRYP